MPRFAANASMMFTEVPFLDRFAAVAEAGFPGIEFLFPYDWPADAIGARLRETGLVPALFNLPPGDWAAGERGLAALPGREDEFRHSLDRAMPYVEATGVRQLHVMAGITAGLDQDYARDVYLANLDWAARQVRGHGLDLLIEPINPRDMPGYFLADLDQTADVIREVGAPNLLLQFDIYHRQVTCGDVSTALWEHFALIGHVQVASVPDRAEPDSGELNDSHVFRTLDALNYRGWVGCEYRPLAGTVEGLGWFRRWREGR